MMLVISTNNFNLRSTIGQDFFWIDSQSQLIFSYAHAFVGTDLFGHGTAKIRRHGGRFAEGRQVIVMCLASHRRSKRCRGNGQQCQEMELWSHAGTILEMKWWWIRLENAYGILPATLIQFHLILLILVLFGCSIWSLRMVEVRSLRDDIIYVNQYSARLIGGGAREASHPDEPALFIYGQRPKKVSVEDCPFL